MDTICKLSKHVRKLLITSYMDQKRSLTVREKNDEYVDSFDRDMSFHPNFEYFLSLVNTEITLEVDKATTIEFVDKILGFI